MKMFRKKCFGLIAGSGAVLTAVLFFVPGAARAAISDPASEIRTLLPKDAIRSIDDPKFVSTKEADKFMRPDEMVLGVSINGDNRAYSIPLLSSHEIVNDVVGGRKIAVTW